jgi:N-acetylmuramoyl-L-alanine amidase
MPWVVQVPKSQAGPTSGPVKELQRRLKAAGFDPGPTDGWFGPRTAEAVRRFQQAKGLKVDAQVGPKTWGSLGLQGAPRTPSASPGPAVTASPTNPNAPSGLELPPAPTIPPAPPAPAAPPEAPAETAPAIPAAPGGNAPKPPVIPMPSPSQGSRNGVKVDTIVLHHTASGGTAEDVGVFAQNPANKVSSHYVVGKDGAIVQSVEDEQRAWHAGKSEFEGRDNVNDFSIGIEIVNWGNGTDPYPDTQYKALAKLVLYLQDKYDIPWERVIGHKDVALPRGRKIDPSANFDYDKLRAEVAIAQGF